MKTALFLLVFACLSVTAKWGNDFEKAKEVAKQENRHILLNFSGSDWCGPCIRMHDEIFQDEAFQSFADKNLVLVNADFPRLKKNQLSKELQKKNDHLADVYNTSGIFPLTLLLDADGKVLKSWEGCPQGHTDKFVDELKTAMDAAK